MKIKISILCLLSISILLSCKEQNQTEVNQTDEGAYPELPQWAKNANIYEVNIRQYTDEANINGFVKHIDRLDDMGVDILWLMPIHPISVLKRKAKGDLIVADIEDPEEQKKYLGSPYAVADYKAVNPDYGTLDDFKRMLAKAHSLDMKVIIDWVPNHTGWDNPWITEHPEWYTKDSLGQITDPINYETGESWGWTDVADLDYSNKEMRAAMLAAMQYWVDEVGIDGFRVDVAHGIEQSFWDEMKAVFEGEDIFLLAESEVPSHRNSGAFHADYGWSFHHLLNDIAKGEKNVTDIREWLEKNRSTYDKGFHMHFTSNHDENSWAGTEFDRMGDAHKVLAVLTATFEGMPLIYSGQEEPLRRRLAFFSQESIGFEKYEYADFYKTLWTLKHKNESLWNGSYGGNVQIISPSEHVFAFTREKNGNKTVAILNLSDTPQPYTLSESISAFKNVFTNENVDIPMNTEQSIEAWGFIVATN